MSYHKTIIEGNLGSDPDVKYLDTGTAVAQIRVAVNESFKNRNGETIKHTEWYNCKAWGDRAKFIEKYCQSGTRVLLEMKKKDEEYTKDNQKKIWNSFNIERVVLLGNTRPQENQQANNTPEAAPQAQPSAPAPEAQQANNTQPTGGQQASIDNFDDLPF